MASESIELPFDSIESAYGFMDLLAETVLDAIKDLDHDREVAVLDGQARRAQAIELAIFKAKTLSSHVHKSRGVLNDLRTLRRLILNERMSPERLLADVQAS
jgi:hypothetical protein